MVAQFYFLHIRTSMANSMMFNHDLAHLATSTRHDAGTAVNAFTTLCAWSVYMACTTRLSNRHLICGFVHLTCATRQDTPLDAINVHLKLTFFSGKCVNWFWTCLALFKMCFDEVIDTWKLWNVSVCQLLLEEMWLTLTVYFQEIYVRSFGSYAKLLHSLRVLRLW